MQQHVKSPTTLLEAARVADFAFAVIGADLRLRFATPNISKVLHVSNWTLNGDMNNDSPLADDFFLLQDIRAVLRHLKTIEREVTCPSGVPAIRRIQPCRTHTRHLDGVMVSVVFERDVLPQACNTVSSGAIKTNKIKAIGAAIRPISNLTSRQREIMDLVLSGKPSKTIATTLGISQRTVENHRAGIMKRTGCRSLPELARVALLASLNSESGLEVAAPSWYGNL